MKKLTFVLFAVITIGLLFGISSCQNSQPTNTTTDQYSMQDFSLPPASNVQSDISEATENQDMQMQVPSGYSREDCRVMGWGGSQGMGMKTDMMGGGFQRWMYLGRILYQLKLDSTQVSEIKGYIKDYMSCVQNAMVTLRQSEKVIIQTANQSRKTIMDSLKTGQITRQQAWQDLKLLNQSTRQALKNNPARLVACEAIKACRDTLFANIESVLTPEQLTKWNAWKANVPNIPCS